jgi:hypothetical protein
MFSKNVLVTIVVASAMAMVAAECPNSCSGHGTCGANDMCTCYRNWQSSDCSERTCPYGWSFTTTPQGDINMDGDRLDSSLMPVVFKADVSTAGPFAGEPILASVAMLSDQLIFNANIDSSELTAGDCVLVHYKSGDSTTPKQFCIKSVSTSSPLTTFTLDADNDEAAEIADSVVYKMLVDQANPQGTWESWPGTATTKWADDGHFYMECSNAGSCDRAEGTCMCYSGYTGLACARTTCPADCSGHGTCMDVQELSVKSPNKLSLTATATRGSTWVATNTDATGAVASGDRVFLGEQATYEESSLHTVGLVKSTGFYVTPAARKSLPFGSTLYSSSSYGLWDASKNQGCKCDPGFTGYACDEKVCPHGADPLDSRGEDYNQSTSTDSVASYYTKATETQTLTYDTSCGVASGFFTVTHTDQITGEKVTSQKVQATPQLSSTVTVTTPAASDVKWCPTSGSHVGVMGTTTFYPTSALSNLAEAGKSVANTQGVAGAACLKYVVFEPHLPTYELSVGDFVRVGQEYREIGAFVQDTVSGNYSAAYVTSRFSNAYAAGSLAFRTNAAQVLKSALQSMDNGAVTSATVSKRVGGTQLEAFFEIQNDAKLGTSIMFETAAGAKTNVQNLCVGDVIATNNYDDAPSSANVNGAQQYMYQVQNAIGNDETAGTGTNGMAGASVGPPNSFIKGTATPSLVATTFGEVAVSQSVAAGATATTVTHAAFNIGYVATAGDVITVSGHTGVANDLLMNQQYVVASRGSATAMTLTGAGMSAATYTTGSIVLTAHAGTTGDEDKVPFRMSGGSYEIQTDIDGDQTELVCGTDDLRAVYVASSAGHVDASEPQKVVFVDHTYGANQPTPKSLQVFGGHPANHPEALTIGDVLYVGEQKCSITSVDAHGTSETAANVGLVHDVSATSHYGGDSVGFVLCAETLNAVNLAVVEIVIGGATTSCTSTDMRPIQWQNGLQEDNFAVNIVLANGAMRKVEAITPATYALVDFDDISIGDRVMLALGNGLFETRTIDSIASDFQSFTVQKAFSASVITTTAYKMYIVGKGSKSHTECAGRGLCDDASGECQCFRGYTQAACQEQSALAA